MPKVIVGMSGGVDSSVAAHILKSRGFDVEGISFILWEARNRASFTTCCSLEAMQSASRTAGTLGIPQTALDVRDEFIERVIEPFVDAYSKGITPNPCILCNRHIKFPFLLREAEKRGAEFISTGHYARVEHIRDPLFGSPDSGKVVSVLKKGIDHRKDQSYVLYVLQPEELKRLMLPLGVYRKEEVREMARSLKLEAANRPESQEICFIEDRNYFKFIEKLTPLAGQPGPIIDRKGNVVGTHRGIYCYTIGQRKGLGISSLEPYYVTRIDTFRNTVYVGSRDDAKIATFSVNALNWIVPPESGMIRATVKIRSMMEANPASIQMFDNQRFQVIFDEPQWAPAPGQSAVFYDGDIVLGGGVIVL